MLLILQLLLILVLASYASKSKFLHGQIKSKVMDDSADRQLSSVDISIRKKVIKALKPVLPKSSKKAIAKVDTPQFRAFQWLLSNAGIENFSITKIRQRYAVVAVLIAGYTHFDDANLNLLLEYLGGSDECEKWGISCNADGVITSLLFDKLSGPPLADISILTDLEVLQLPLHIFTGPSPSFFLKMKKLEFLYLIFNNNTLKFRVSKDTLEELGLIALALQDFTGEITPSIETLQKLGFLELRLE